MMTLTIDEFSALAVGGVWTRSDDYDVTDRATRIHEEWSPDGSDVLQTAIPSAWGFAWRTSTLGGIKVTYTEGFDYDEYMQDSLKTGTEGQENIWKVEGVSVVDSEGEIMSADEIADYLTPEFRGIDYSMLQIAATEDIDIDEGSGMEVFTLDIDNAPSIRFSGELIARAVSSDNRAMTGSYSGSAGRWTELALYRTAGGKYICHQIGRTRWQGERDRFSGKVCETHKDVTGFFGHRWLAKELYAAAKIDDTLEID